MSYSYYLLTFYKYSENNYSASLNLNFKKISLEIHPIFDANGEKRGMLVGYLWNLKSSK